MAELLEKKQIKKILYRFQKYLKNNFIDKIEYLNEEELEYEKTILNKTIEQITEDTDNSLANDIFKQYLTNLRKDFYFIFIKLDQVSENFERNKKIYNDSNIKYYLIDEDFFTTNKFLEDFRINSSEKKDLDLLQEYYEKKEFDISANFDEIIFKNRNEMLNLENLNEIKQTKRDNFMESFAIKNLNDWESLRGGEHNVGIRLDFHLEQDQHNIGITVNEASTVYKFAEHFHKTMEFHERERNYRYSIYVYDYGLGQDVGGLTRDYVTQLSAGFTSRAYSDENTPFKTGDNKLSYFNTKFNDIRYYRSFGKLLALSLINKVRLHPVIKLHPSIIFGFFFLNNMPPERQIFVNLLKENKNSNLPKVFKNEQPVKQSIIETIQNKYYGYSQEKKENEIQYVSGLNSFKLSKYVFDNSIPISRENDRRKTFESDNLGFHFEYDINFILEIFNQINEAYKEDQTFDFINNQKYDSLCMFRHGFICPESYLSMKSNKQFPVENPEDYYYAEIVAENYLPKLKDIVNELIPDFKINDVSAQTVLDDIKSELEGIYDSFMSNPNIKQIVNAAVVEIEQRLLAIRSIENLSYELQVINNIKNVKMPMIIKDYSNRRKLQFLYNYFYEHIEKIKAIKDGFEMYIYKERQNRGIQNIYSKLNLRNFMFIIFGPNYDLQDFLNKIIFVNFNAPSNSEVKTVFDNVISEYYTNLDLSNGEGSGDMFLGKVLYYITGSFSLPFENVEIKGSRDISQEFPDVRMYAHTCFNYMDYKIQPNLNDYERFLRLDFDPDTFTGRNAFSKSKKYLKLSDYTNY